MKQKPFIISILIILISLNSCDRILKKSERTAEKTKEVVSKNSDKIVQKVFPSFDSDKSLTDNNKNRFREFLEIDITPDVKEIYCFDDAIGIDSDYMFAFHCDLETSNRIIETHNLTLDEKNSDNGFGLQHEFEWWDRERIAELDKYSWNSNKQYFKYYWYDEKNQKAYYFEFSM